MIPYIATALLAPPWCTVIVSVIVPFHSQHENTVSVTLYSYLLNCTHWLKHPTIYNFQEYNYHYYQHRYQHYEAMITTVINIIITTTNFITAVIATTSAYCSWSKWKWEQAEVVTITAVMKFVVVIIILIIVAKMASHYWNVYVLASYFCYSTNILIKKTVINWYTLYAAFILCVVYCAFYWNIENILYIFYNIWNIYNIVMKYI